MPDHPRVRGEHILIFDSAVSYRGSPPRTRGAPILVTRRVYGHRITPAYAGSTTKGRRLGDGWTDHPAYAGSTRWRLTLEPSSEDHPRVRGEHDVGVWPAG